MRVAVTGTPGTGKTTVTRELEAGATALDIIHLNDVLTREELYTERDEKRDSLIADMDALTAWLEDKDDIIFESHLAHHIDADRVVVLRCHPETLKTRLLERGESPAKASENAESEALDVILAEAVSNHGLESVYEIDTTDREPATIAADLEAVVDGTREPSAGTVDFMGYLT